MQLKTKTVKKIRKTSNLVVPIPVELKTKVMGVLEELGLNQSQIVVALFKEIARTNKIPLSFDLNDEWKNARIITADEQKEIDEGIASGFLTPAQSSQFLEEIGYKR